METRQLGRTDVRVSSICLGTMTWGQQNTEADAFAQMDYAVDNGINFFDTAELYPVPPMAETQGRTEAFIGNWMQARGNRDKIVLATKVVGRSGMDWFRPWDGETALDQKNIELAIDNSLRRLKTDYIDLYQLHWPDRQTNTFGKLNYGHTENDGSVPLLDTLQILDGIIKAGKIRHVGLSNETAWGTMKFMELSSAHDLPRMISIQNPYNLLNRSFEVALAEVAHREDMGLLPYSPMACGMLSGKYLNGQWPEGARLTLFKRFSRYNNPQCEAAITKYVATAQKYGLDPGQMALQYVTTRSFVTSNIIGATTMEQLKANIDSVNLTLSSELLAELEQIHTEHVFPGP